MSRSSTLLDVITCMHDRHAMANFENRTYMIHPT